MSMAHKGGGYRSGCRCADCVEKHRVQGFNYYRSVKAELLELRAFKAQFEELAAQLPGSSR